MRLIDAEKCPCKNCEISYCYENCNKYYEWLNGCAYDVEKVVMNLRCDTNCSNCSPCCADAIICGFDECLKQAIEIVRNGGVEQCD